MPYVYRDSDGNITGLTEASQCDGQEFVEGAVLYVPPSTKDQRIKAVLAELPRPMTREQVQTAVIACEGFAKANNLTLAYIYDKTKLYRICKDAETACSAIEAGP